jgi:hypothetical protein
MATRPTAEEMEAALDTPDKRAALMLLAVLDIAEAVTAMLSEDPPGPDERAAYRRRIASRLEASLHFIDAASHAPHTPDIDVPSVFPNLYKAVEERYQDTGDHTDETLAGGTG